VNHLSGGNAAHRFAEEIGQRAKIFQLGTADREHDHTKASSGDSLLVLHLPICGNEHLDPGGTHPSEQLTVEDSRPALASNGGHPVAGQLARKEAWEHLIQQDPSPWFRHLRSRGLRYMGKEPFDRLLQEGSRLFACY